MLMRQRLTCAVTLALLSATNGFALVSVKPLSQTPFSLSKNQHAARLHLLHPPQAEVDEAQKRTLAERICHRLDTLDAAGLKNETDAPQYQIGFKRAVLLAALAFGYKWYRARFINKIPVWDRQPQWNTVVTSKEQEKELKAFTCKTCGSTIFIARHRGWFFEGTFGLGGLGCYTCGAKGKDNFVMDRDRIVEDVGDEDDYFDYERPLDFVSAAERRKLLKQAGGDEDMANQFLAEQTSSSADVAVAEEESEFARAVAEAAVEEATVEEIAEEAVVDAVVEDGAVEEVAEDAAVVDEIVEEDAAVVDEIVEEAVVEEVAEEAVVDDIIDEAVVEEAAVQDEIAEEAVIVEEDTEEETKVEAVKDEPEVAEEEPSKKKESAPQAPTNGISDDDIFDLLDD